MELALYETRKRINSYYTKNNYEFANIIDRMIINIYNNSNNIVKKAMDECREKGIDPELANEAYTIFNKTMKSKVKSKNLIPFELEDKYEFLHKKYPNVGKTELVKCVLRYATLGFGGQQWALGYDMMDKIRELGIEFEAFASPFNNYFPNYCSIFADDAPFGSHGDFFQYLTPENIYVNPPFVPAILSRVPEHLANVKKCVVITPTWRDTDWYQALAKKFNYNQKTGETYRAVGKEFVPKFTTTIWTFGLTDEETQILLN